MAWTGGRLTSVAEGTNVYTYSYDGDGLRTERHAGNETHRYLYSGSTLVRIEREAQGTFDYLDFLFDGQSLVGFRYCNPESNTEAVYYFVFGHGGNVEGVVDDHGNLLVKYVYDAWGNFTETFRTNDAAILTALSLNPLRYRGYVYDYETGFYYLQSRYYDPNTGRFISPDSYVSTGQGFVGYNMFAYCGNDPILHIDPSGQAFFTALLVGVIVGAIVGGAAGGTISYMAAKESGLDGKELFLETAEGVVKGAVIGSVAGGLAGATGGAIAAYGAGSLAGTAMITGTLTTLAKASEVAVLQTKKSTNDGKTGWQIADDCLDSLFSNGQKILSTVPSKATTTSLVYIYKDWKPQYRVVPLDPQDYLRTKSSFNKLVSYAGLAWELHNVVISCFHDDPIARANQRGYILK